MPFIENSQRKSLSSTEAFWEGKIVVVEVLLAYYYLPKLGHSLVQQAHGVEAGGQGLGG